MGLKAGIYCSRELCFCILSFFILSCTTPQLALANCLLGKVIFSEPEFEVSVSIYRPNSGAEKTVLVILSTGRTNFIDRSHAKAICRSGVRAVILGRWTGGGENRLDLGVHNRLYLRSQRAVGLALENLESDSFGVLGRSVGALYASMAMANFDQVSKAFLIVGGGDIASIIADSDQGVLVTARKKRMKKYGFGTAVEYADALRETISLEPLKLPFDRSQKKIGMIISNMDKTVPTRNQLLLRDHLKPDFELYTSMGHRAAVAKAWFSNQPNIVQFFKG